MLIKALCDYYDILSEAGLLVPDGYTEVNTQFKVALNENGDICEIINVQTPEQRGKKTVFVPKAEIFPKRAEVSAVFANYIDHRPLYLFGLSVNKVIDVIENDEKKKENIFEITEKSAKSFEKMVEKNLDFLKDVDSPVVNAFKNFLKKWNPKNELENPLLKKVIGYNKSGFSFCLYGNPECVLHKDKQVLAKWESLYFQDDIDDETIFEQCSVTGEVEKMARIHDKIKNLGNATGNVLVCFNNPCDESYGRKKSYNCNISETAMKKYTTALNYLLKNRDHYALFEDLRVVFWAMNSVGTNEMLLNAALLGSPDNVDAEKMDKILVSLMKDARDGVLTTEMLNSIDGVDGNVDFYMAGLTPNVARIAVNFIHKNKFVDVMKNVIEHQQNMQVTDEFKPIYMYQIKDALLVQKDKMNSSDTKIVHASLMAKIFEAAMFGSPYPQFLLADIVRRVKVETQANSYINRIRAGIIRTCVNKNHHKEVKSMLDTENKNVAYLCGRLFALLEKIQRDSVRGTLNRTIKDTYFSSAASRPASIFPRLIQLSKSHMKKIQSEHPAWATRHEKLLQDIMGMLETEFPKRLSLVDQGVFYLGYYQQFQDFFTKKDGSEELTETENIEMEDN